MGTLNSNEIIVVMADAEVAVFKDKNKAWKYFEESFIEECKDLDIEETKDNLKYMKEEFNKLGIAGELNSGFPFIVTADLIE